MPMTVEAALVTKKASDAEFNTDSVNASGKTWSREAVHSEKGIRAVGTGKDVPYYVLASSAAKGTAESAADLFKSCTDIFDKDMSNCSEVISEFYSSFAKVLNEAEFKAADCELSVFCGFGSEVFLSKSGNAKLYTLIDGNFAEAVPQMFDFTDGTSSYGVCNFKNVKQNDLFILLNSNVASVLPEGFLKAISASADGDIKKFAAIISAQAEKYGCKGAVSAVIIKITDADAPVVIPVEEKIAEQPVIEENNSENQEPLFDFEKEQQPEENPCESKKSGKIGFIIVLTIFFILLALLGFLAGKGIANRSKIDDAASATDGLLTTEAISETDYTTEPVTENTTEVNTSTEATSEALTTVSTTVAADEIKQTTTRSSNTETTEKSVENTTKETITTETTTEIILTTEPTTQPVETTTERESDTSEDNTPVPEESENDSESTSEE